MIIYIGGWVAIDKSLVTELHHVDKPFEEADMWHQMIEEQKSKNVFELKAGTLYHYFIL